MIFIMIISYIIIAVIDTSKLFKTREYGKITVYYLLMVISAAIGGLAGSGVKIPNPAKAIEHIVKAIVGI